MTAVIKTVMYRGRDLRIHTVKNNGLNALSFFK